MPKTVIFIMQTTVGISDRYFSHVILLYQDTRLVSAYFQLSAVF